VKASLSNHEQTQLAFQEARLLGAGTNTRGCAARGSGAGVVPPRAELVPQLAANNPSSPSLTLLGDVKTGTKDVKQMGLEQE
jgi:hypothetical protein